jgi:hypothetical protein
MFSSRALRAGRHGRGVRARPLATILHAGRATPTAAGDVDGDGRGDLIVARGRDVVVVTARRMN